jgi:probable F420-dependent oxidoreductase
MKVDASISANLTSVAEAAKHLEALGYDGLRVAELNNDPFLPLTLAAEHTRQIELITSVAVAFARNPMTLAHIAHDLNAYSGGRFVLGLGSQVKPHIEKRFSMPWYKGARQMREFIEAMQAIFDCWYDGEPLDFRGEYYQHTLMPKTFTPADTSAGRPRIVLSATGPLMTKVAAEVADGLIMHPFTTEQYIREVTLPAVQQGLARNEEERDEFELDFAPMIASGTNEEALSKSIGIARDRIAFYGSTPGYRGVLELHGWGELQEELNFLHKQHRVEEMASLIDDEILHTFAVVGEPNQVVDEILKRYSDIIDRTAFSIPTLSDADHSTSLMKLQGPVAN